MTEFEAEVIKQLKIANQLKAVECCSLFTNTYNKGLLEKALANIGDYPEGKDRATTYSELSDMINKLIDFCTSMDFKFDEMAIRSRLEALK